MDDQRGFGTAPFDECRGIPVMSWMIASTGGAYVATTLVENAPAVISGHTLANVLEINFDDASGRGGAALAQDDGVFALGLG